MRAVLIVRHRTTKRIKVWLATICLRLALRRVCVGTQTGYMVRIIKKDAQLRTIYPPFTGSIKCRSRVAKPQRLYAYLSNAVALLSTGSKSCRNI